MVGKSSSISLHLTPFLLEGGELKLPIISGRPHRPPTILLALVPELHARGRNEGADQFVVLFLPRVAAERFPGVVAATDAYHQARVGECRAVASRHQMIALQNKLAIVRVSVALGDAVVVEVTKYASLVAGNHDFACDILDFTLDCRGV